MPKIDTLDRTGINSLDTPIISTGGGGGGQGGVDSNLPQYNTFTVTKGATKLAQGGYGKTSVEKSRLTNLQGLALLRLYKSFRGWLWQKPLLFWVGWAQGRAVGSSKICTGFSACWTLLDRFVWQLWAPSAPYVIVPWTLQETKRWIKNNKSGSGSW